MKKELAILALATASTLAFSLQTTYAAADISVGVQIGGGVQVGAVADFRAPLAPYGAWFDYKDHGNCWRPAHVEADWQPYTVGSWQWTDAGWYWQSDEPWAWATYHYGSWDYDPSYGWVWIPATDWAPAWVTWRDSDDYIGWAPCGPGLVVLAPSLFVFCDIHHFGGHFHSHELIRHDENIINRTHVVKDFHRESMDFDGHRRTIFTNKGPGVEPIERATGQKFTPRPVRDVVREAPRPENTGRNENQRPEERQGQQPNRETTPPPTGRDQQHQYQQPGEKNPATPGQRPNMNPGERQNATPPTGRDQQHIYQQPGEKNPATPGERQNVNPSERQNVNPSGERPNTRPQEVNPPSERQNMNPPTGRDQQHIYQEPSQKTPAAPQERPTPNTPQERPKPNTPNTPTGGEQQRIYHDNQTPAQPKEAPKSPERPATPPERPATPPEKPAERPLPPTGREQAQPPPQHAAPAEHAAPPAAPPAPKPSAPPQQNNDGRDGQKRDGNQ
jgi:hypothetical protein